MVLISFSVVDIKSGFPYPTPGVCYNKYDFYVVDYKPNAQPQRLRTRMDLLQVRHQLVAVPNMVNRRYVSPLSIR